MRRTSYDASTMQTTFANRSVLVTGGGSGIARATARRFADAGAQVRIGDVDDAGMTETCKGHPGITQAHLDVTDAASVEVFVSGAISDHGRIDIVVNLAGILSFANSHEVDPARWTKILDVNLTGTFLVCQSAIRQMLAPERGRTDGVIINAASTAAHIGQAWSAAYCASKGGVLSLTRALAVEYAKRGIRVVSVSPGATDTPITSAFAFPEGADQSLLYRTMPLTPIATPDEIAAAIAYLASGEARYVTGTDLRIDGATTS